MLAYLAERPYENVYVAWLLATHQLERGSSSGAIWRDDCEAIAGFCYYGQQIVPCVSSGAASEAPAAFADHARGVQRPRGIVGPKETVDAFWSRARAIFPEPELVRSCQPLYALERRTLRGGRRDAAVGRATRAELDEIVPHAARMIAGEIGGDPRRANSEFRGRTGRIIDAGWWWRYRVLGELAFMCYVGSASDRTAQLQGVWTPPRMRGRGYATRGLAAICDHLLDEHPSLSLYVNDFNAPAIALYERVGFERVGTFASIILG